MVVEIQALDKLEELTPLGRLLAKFPIDPRMGKFLLTACCFGLGDAASSIAAHGSSFQEVFLMRESLANENTTKLCFCRPMSILQDESWVA
jgi:ATP-dependent RNA helicase DHX36